MILFISFSVSHTGSYSRNLNFMPSHNSQLVGLLEIEGVLKTKSIIRAFTSIDRAHFVPHQLKHLAYQDIPLPIGYGQTLSQPSVVAFMLELLSPGLNQCILDIGVGSGWTTALLAHIVGSRGLVYGTEIMPNIFKKATRNPFLYKHKNIHLVQAFPHSLGLPQFSPFDRIIVSASTKKLPQTLQEQLSDHGIMVIPVNHSIVRLTKTPKDQIHTSTYPGYSFVSLIER